MKARVKRYRVTCQCGCRQKFSANRPDQLYKDHAHQQAAYRQRVRESELADRKRQMEMAREVRARRLAEEAERQRLEAERQMAARRVEQPDRWRPHERQVELALDHPSMGRVYPVSEVVEGKARWKVVRQDSKDYFVFTSDGKDQVLWLFSEVQEAYRRKGMVKHETISYPQYRA